MSSKDIAGLAALLLTIAMLLMIGYYILELK